jgi:hypothetical protein
MVDGEPITLDAFQSELARYEAARGTDLATPESAGQTVLQALIERRLLAQAARESGFSVDDSRLDERVQKLMDEVGGPEAFSRWLRDHQYSNLAFRESLREELLGLAFIRQLADSVPIEELHAHARHILLPTEEEAREMLDQILAGADFSELAATNSLDLSTRPGGGDLGWFPRDTLTTAELEEVIFILQPGDFGPIIKSDLGYHIVQLIDLEERTLSNEALIQRHAELVEKWLNARMDEVPIEIFITP